MARFAAGETQLLVATTVIEVGVDVPDATVMVIEHAERFGLAQLHQLRGRVGRGRDRSTCLLLYRAPLGETAKARLAIMRDTEDGFRIAEEDLRLRGEGDLLGTRQSGMPDFRVARIEVHGELLAAARDDAALILARDPDLAVAARRRVARTCSICSNATRRSGCCGPAEPARRSLTALRGFGQSGRRGGQRLVQIGNDVVDVLDADRQPDISRRHAARELILRAQLRMRGAGRMDRQRAHIADIGDVIEQLQRVDEARAGLAAPL